MALDEWLSCRPTAATKNEDILIDDPADIVYAHSLHPRIPISKSHLLVDIIEWDIFFRLIEGPEVRSSTAYISLEKSIEFTILLCETLVFVTTIYKALEDIAERVDPFENLNLRVVHKWGRQRIQVLVTTGQEFVDIFSETR